MHGVVQTAHVVIEVRQDARLRKWNGALRVDVPVHIDRIARRSPAIVYMCVCMSVY
jgi:hypothetical protein